ncbi:MAG: aldehyde dehydrogenase family protein [Pseudonocardia sp.]|nr:aldehyde dehydrogenase family protein [Pseudonocardia sp.]
MIDHQGVWTEEALGCAALGVADRLVQLGLESGDRVALVAPNSTGYVLVLLALTHLDVSLVLLDEDQATCDRVEALRRASVRWLIREATCAVEVETSATVLDLDELVRATPRPAGAGQIDLSRWWQRTDALIIWSSGTTTGQPTAVVRSGSSLRANTRRTYRRMGYNRSDVLLPLLPFSHQYGLSLLLLWWQIRCCVVVLPYRRLDHAMEAITRIQVTVVDGAPSTYDSLLRIMQQRSVGRAALESVRMWCVGGAPLSSALAARFAETVGKPLLDGYGSSEAGNIALAGPECPLLCGLPLDGIEIDVVGEDDMPLPAGAVGELVVRTPDLMVGTLDENGAIQTVDWSVHRTNDIGYLDQDGNLAVLGRLGAVHRHGHTLYPDVISRKAEACGAPVRVVAVDDEGCGCQLVFVVVDPNRGDSATWKRAIRPHLATHEQPSRVLVVPRLPLNRNGKVDMAELYHLVEQSDRSISSNGGIAVAERKNDHLSIPLAGRIREIEAVHRLLTENRRRVMDVLTEVSGYKTATNELDSSLRTLRGAADEVLSYRPTTVGHTAVFMPSNIPLYAYVLYLLVPSLYSERITFRPSSHINQQIVRLHEMINSEVHLPIELSPSTQREFVEGPVRAADLVVFTGTYANAEKIRVLLGREQLFVYLGQGINPFVVGPGADLERTVADLVEIRMLNSGQDCFGPDVIFVHQSVSEEFLALLTQRLDGLRFGGNTDPNADYGPMHYAQAFGFALEYLRGNAEQIQYGGKADLKHRRLQPTVLCRDIGEKLNCEELFAPIFNVVRFSATEPLHRVLTSPFFEERAMGAMVYGDLPQTVRVLARRHEVCRNTTLLRADNGNEPFGGRGMMANYLSIGGKRSAEPVLISKAIADYLQPIDRQARRSG